MSVASPATRRLIGARARQRLERASQGVLGSHPDVVAVYLYGSAIRGEAARDLDVAVLFRAEPPPPSALEALAARLQREGAPDGPEIDLRCLNRTAPRFRASVMDEGSLLLERDPAARIEAEARAFSEWLDFKPVWERMRRRMLERLADG